MARHRPRSRCHCRTLAPNPGPEPLPLHCQASRHRCPRVLCSSCPSSSSSLRSCSGKRSRLALMARYVRASNMSPCPSPLHLKQSQCTAQLSIAAGARHRRREGGSVTYVSVTEESGSAAEGNGVKAKARQWCKGKGGSSWGREVVDMSRRWLADQLCAWWEMRTVGLGIR